MLAFLYASALFLMKTAEVSNEVRTLHLFDGGMR